MTASYTRTRTHTLDTSISVRHNMEMAHRLTQTHGKCENIHGHSWEVTLTLVGNVDDTGKLNGAEYGELKQIYRRYLDTTFDHHLLLNKDDPLAQVTYKQTPTQPIPFFLPGTTLIACDPTTENIAATIGEWAVNEFGDGLGFKGIAIEVWETMVNQARWEVHF